MRSIEVTLNEQQVSLVLGMIYEGRKSGLFDESEKELVDFTEKLFEQLENEMYHDYIIIGDPNGQ